MQNILNKKPPKKILILGSSSDIGYELTKILLNTNNHLHLHYFSNKNSLKRINSKKVKLIKSNFGLSQKSLILKKFDNNYDAIINLVGYIDNKSFNNFSYDNLIKSLTINSIVPMLIIRKSVDNMLKKKYGRIINTSSIGVKFGGGKNTFSYSLSKHINEFIPSFFKILAENNVFYNVLRIGLTDTKIHKKIKRKNMIQRVKMLPTKKMAKPIDIANYINFLCLENNNFITNEIINISGGE
mgnify:CR=1 FL=1